MVEQTDVLLHEGDAQLLGSVEDGAIVLAATRGGDILGTRARCAENIVDEGEL